MVINIETVNRLYNDYIKRVNEFSEAKIPDSVQLEFEEIGEPAHYSDMTKNVTVNLKMIKDKNHLKAVVIHELRHAQQDIMVENFKDIIVGISKNKFKGFNCLLNNKLMEE